MGIEDLTIRCEAIDEVDDKFDAILAAKEKP